MVEFTLNGKSVSTNEDDDMPLLWAVRDIFKLKGSKFGCGAGLCGACTMYVDGMATRTCILPLSAVAGAQVTTIEGVGTPENLHALQKAWIKHGVPQCGYCQSGQIMSAYGLLQETLSPSEDDIEMAMAGNICRCGTYSKIKLAILDAAAELRGEGGTA